MCLNKIDELHDKAMDLAEEALIAQHHKQDNVKELFEKAYAIECQAVELIQPLDIEPSRSVLHRSAAALACNCERYSEAQRLAMQGLTEHAPIEIKEELEHVKRVSVLLKNLQIIAPALHHQYNKKIMKTTTEEELRTLKQQFDPRSFSTQLPHIRRYLEEHGWEKKNSTCYEKAGRTLDLVENFDNIEVIIKELSLLENRSYANVVNAIHSTWYAYEMKQSFGLTFSDQNFVAKPSKNSEVPISLYDSENIYPDEVPLRSV